MKKHFSVLMSRCRTWSMALLGLVSLWQTGALAQECQDLSGEWEVTTTLSPAAASLHLPGTLDMAGIGVPTTLQPRLFDEDGAVNREVMRHLTRKVSYIGEAQYERDIEVTPQMAGKPLRFCFERVLWRSRLWVDGKEVDTSCESLSTPHVYRLPQGLMAGRHRVRLTVDNAKQYDMSYEDMAHAYTNETQTMWNGLLGEMKMEVEPVVADVQVYPNVKERNAVVRLTTNGKKVKRPRFILSDREVGTTRLNDSTFLLPVRDMKVWNEFTPSLYRLTVEANGECRTATFGMRELSSEKGYLELNGERIFLRATLECCVFPLTGCPPTTEEGWRRVFESAKRWGLNSLRFHSYCPPDAAFRVADQMGFYLQVELPNWSLNIGENPEAEAFFYREFDRIVRAYGNHPSFCLMTAGNELQKDFGYLNALCHHMKESDPRHLYAATTFTFEKGHGGHPEPEDQFFVTQWTDKGWVRGQGVFDEEVPNFSKDYSEAAAGWGVPIVSHEIGQYSVYPNMAEIEKYTGVLEPLNLMAIRHDLKEKGLLMRAQEYTEASGRLAVQLYKEEIERALKTRDMNGYQLLGLQDFPGQSTALVGLVDAFWDNKGLCTEAYFRQFCAPVVPLIRLEKAAWNGDETLEARVEVANYATETIEGRDIRWQLTTLQGDTIGGGIFPAAHIAKGALSAVGTVSCPLSAVKDAEQLALSVRIEGTPYRNTWNVWVYGTEVNLPEGVVVTTSVEEAIAKASAGKRVLLHPERKEQVKGIEGKFLPVFWSPVHFPKQAGTMGLLLHPRHPVFRHFPTEMNSDWQWWNVVKRSRVMVLDEMPTVTPLIESVDNFVHNRRLSLMFEAQMGKGSIVVSSIEMATDLPEMRHLLYSTAAYMASEDFAPKADITPQQLRGLFGNSTAEQQTDAMSIYQ